MNKLYPTKTGFVLITNQKMPIEDISRICKQLREVTGMDWVILPETEAGKGPTPYPPKFFGRFEV